MESPGERRESFRMPLISEVICRAEDTAEIYQGTLCDISVTGLFMKTEERPPIGTVCHIEIVLNGKNSRLAIDELKGNVLRHEAEGVAMRFFDRLEWVALVPIYSHKMQEQLAVK